MPILYRIVSDKKVAYIKASGKITVDEIMIEGARMFAETEWENGFNVLCDYREATEFEPIKEDIQRISDQDKAHEPLFDKSKCAIVATSDLVFGLSRMWEILSHNTNLTTNVFRDIREAIDWLEMDMDFLAMMKKLP
jgi:hypothetical protein